MTLLLRLFAECIDAAHATDIQRQLVASLDTLPMRPIGSPKQYWKMPALYEIIFAAEPATDLMFDAVIALSPTGWLHFGGEFDRSSVWNCQENGRLLLPQVVWGEVQLSLIR